MPPSGTTAGTVPDRPAALRLRGPRGWNPAGLLSCSPAKRSASRERSFDNAIASEPRLKHPADVQRIQLLVLGAVYLRGVLVIHLAAGHVEAQHRTELRPHADGDVLRQRQLPAVVIPALGRNPRAGSPLPAGVECTSFQKYIGRTMAP